ncbi:MAG: D-2-hydroxyacid dehydrogenase [Steroidobacteraceae bacterium]
MLIGPQAGAQATDAETTRLIAELGLKESARPVSELPGWRAPGRIVVSTADPEQLARLQAAVPDVQLVGVKDDDEAALEARDADAVVGYCNAAVLAAGSRIRWIQTMNAGVERCVAVPGLVERGIVLTNMQKVAGPVMSEHVLALMFGLARGFASYVPLQARGEWSDEAVPEERMWLLEGRTLFVAGLGGIGTEVAERAHALGMNVIATRNTPHEKPPFVSEQGSSGDLLAFAARADVIVDALPLTPETRGLFNKAFFDAAQHGALFINVGRGGTVVTADLVAALQDGRLGGAGLDVTDPEPLPADHPLWHAPNVLITPHVAASISTREESRWLIVRENLRRYAAGGRLLSEVDVKRGY